MDLSRGETQQHLSDSVRGFAAQVSSQTMPALPVAGPDDVWRSLCEDLGLLALMLPEDRGGFGGRGEDLLVVMEAMGEALLAQPFLECAVAALSLLTASTGETSQASVDDLVSGQALAVPILGKRATARFEHGQWQVTGDMGLVYPAPSADNFLVLADVQGAEGSVLLQVPAFEASVRAVATLDERWAGQVVFFNSVAQLLLEGDAAVEAMALAEDMAIAALCAEASGVLQKLLDDTVGFTKERRQFGQPISRFQVLQHRMADMFIQFEMARSAAVLACLSLDKPGTERMAAVSSAKAVVSEACRYIGQNTVQLHGGLGMSAETQMTRWFKRATVIENQLGSRDYHIDRLRKLA